MSAIVAIDTETTGLSLADDIWEFAAIRREEDGAERTVHAFIDHDPDLCRRLPERFLNDHLRRFPGASPEAGCGGISPHSLHRDGAAELIAETLGGDPRPHIVGAVPNFDTERIARLLRDYDLTPGWHYHLVDVENLAVGWLSALRTVAAIKGVPAPAAVEAIGLPWDSDQLSLSCGVAPASDDERHTALGDARWALRLWDAITGGAA